jgi:hypothetical protein
MGFEIINTETEEFISGFEDEHEAEIYFETLSPELKAVCEIDWVDD